MSAIVIGWYCDHSDEPDGESTHKERGWVAHDWVTRKPLTRYGIASARRKHNERLPCYRMNETRYALIPITQDCTDDYGSHLVHATDFAPVCPRAVEVFAPK